MRQGNQLILTGPLAIADQKMMVSCSMRDTGRTIAAVSDVVDEQMTMTLTLPELGYWEITEAMLNEGLPEPHFALSPPPRFVVIRYVASRACCCNTPVTPPRPMRGFF